jgi:hypothetical protein
MVSLIVTDPIAYRQGTRRAETHHQRQIPGSLARFAV